MVEGVAIPEPRIDLEDDTQPGEGMPVHTGEEPHRASRHRRPRREPERPGEEQRAVDVHRPMSGPVRGDSHVQGQRRGALVESARRGQHEPPREGQGEPSATPDLLHGSERKVAGAVIGGVDRRDDGLPAVDLEEREHLGAIADRPAPPQRGIDPDVAVEIRQVSYEVGVAEGENLTPGTGASSQSEAPVEQPDGQRTIWTSRAIGLAGLLSKGRLRQREQEESDESVRQLPSHHHLPTPSYPPPSRSRSIGLVNASGYDSGVTAKKG